MPKQATKRRQHKLIAFKAYYDTDADILNWWEGIGDGERSDMIRDLIRAALGIAPQRRRSATIDLPELLEVRQDTLWIRDALNEMPAYLERIIQQIVQSGGVRQGQPLTAQSPIASDEAALTDAESQRRTRKLKQATW